MKADAIMHDGIEFRPVAQFSGYYVGSNQTVLSTKSGVPALMKINSHTGAVDCRDGPRRGGLSVFKLWREAFPELQIPPPLLPVVEGVEVRLVTTHDRYAVGNDGSVWSRTSGKWVQLKPVKNPKTGYLAVHFQRPLRYEYVHTLVLEAFIGPRPPEMECRHFPDRERTNNHLTNLSWGTSADNSADTKTHGTFNPGKSVGEKHGCAKLNERQVRRIFKLHKTGRYTHRQLARWFNVTAAAVYRIVHGLSWSHLNLVSSRSA